MPDGTIPRRWAPGRREGAALWVLEEAAPDARRFGERVDERTVDERKLAPQHGRPHQARVAVDRLRCTQEKQRSRDDTTPV